MDVVEVRANSTLLPCSADCSTLHTPSSGLYAARCTFLAPRRKRQPSYPTPLQPQWQSQAHVVELEGVGGNTCCVAWFGCARGVMRGVWCVVCAGAGEGSTRMTAERNAPKATMKHPEHQRGLEGIATRGVPGHSDTACVLVPTKTLDSPCVPCRSKTKVGRARLLVRNIPLLASQDPVWVATTSQRQARRGHSWAPNYRTLGPSGCLTPPQGSNGPASTIHDTCFNCDAGPVG